MSEMRNKEKIRYFLITGANSGIGFATTKNLVSRGYSVIMACR